MKIFFNLVILSVLVSLLSGCGQTKPDWVVSPGRVNDYELKKEIKKFQLLREKLPNSNKKLKIIGHGAGSYRHYPMAINDNDFLMGNKAKAKHITHLIDDSFEFNNIDAVEIDAQLPPLSHELCSKKDSSDKSCSFAIHDTPDWSLVSNSRVPNSIKFLRKNTVRAVLNHFVERTYHEQGKQVYLEVKCTDKVDPNVMECITAGKRVAEDIKDIIKNNVLEGKKNWLTIISFFPDALGAFRSELEKIQLHNKVDYGLIAGHDTKGLIGWLGLKEKWAQAKGRVPEFVDRIKNFAIEKYWLNQVWFSTRGISGSSSVFKKIDLERRHKCKDDNQEVCKALEYNVSSYDRGWTSFEEDLTGDEKFSGNLVSIMIDVDD